MKVVLTTLNAKYIHSSLALRYLKHYCQKICPDIAVKEYSINNEMQQILFDLYRQRPDVVGMACYIWNIDASLVLVRLLKKVLPNTLIILGGPEVSYDAAEIMGQNPGVDYIVQGEGEEVFATLLGALRDGWPIISIPGLAMRYGAAAMGSVAKVVEGLDSIHFPYDESDLAELKDKIIYYETSRGCPFSCEYCLSSATRGVRFFEVERVLRELDFFIHHDVKQVKFVDRTFNTKKEHYWPIFRHLAAAECRTNFHFEIAADLLDDDTVAFLKTVKPGRFQFEIGIQSTHEPTLREINRNNDWPAIVKYVSELKKGENIHLHLDLIAGLPFEDYRRFGQSFNDVYNLRPDMLQMGFLKMLKGSSIRLKADMHGYKFSDNAPYEVLANDYLSYDDICRLKIIEELLNQTYNSGRFNATMELLVEECNGDAFKLYDAMADYWEKHDLHLIAHNTKNLFKYIYDFVTEAKPLLSQLCREFLKFDALTGERGAVRPEFLEWDGDNWNGEITSFWRDTERVRKYLPDYQFATWREIKKNYHIEVFGVNIPAYLQDKTAIKKERTIVLFSLRETPPRYITIHPADFGNEGS